MRRYLIAIVLAAAALAPAAAVTAQGSPAPKPKGDRACFYSDNISGWRHADDRTVYLSAGASQVYQLTLFGSCPDLDSAETIGVRTRGGGGGGGFVCDGLDIDLITPSPIGPQVCPVTSMRKLSPREVAALPKKDRP